MTLLLQIVAAAAGTTALFFGSSPLLARSLRLDWVKAQWILPSAWGILSRTRSGPPHRTLRHLQHGLRRHHPRRRQQEAAHRGQQHRERLPHPRVQPAQQIRRGVDCTDRTGRDVGPVAIPASPARGVHLHPGQLLPDGCRSRVPLWGRKYRDRQRPVSGSARYGGRLDAHGPLYPDPGVWWRLRRRPRIRASVAWFADNRDFAQIGDGLSRAGLSRAGFSAAEVEGVMGENWLRFYEGGFGEG